MYCIYCGAELKHHEKVQDNLFECPNCEITFEIYPKSTPAEEIDFDIIEGESTYLTEDGLEEA